MREAIRRVIFMLYLAVVLGGLTYFTVVGMLHR
jgi:hypothetical protein